jgi:hypothetical protein
VPTSKSSQIDDVQYPRIPNKILKDSSHGDVVDCIAVEVVVEMVNDKGCGKILILNV